jgi:hypothetical protein
MNNDEFITELVAESVRTHQGKILNRIITEDTEVYRIEAIIGTKGCAMYILDKASNTESIFGRGSILRILLAWTGMRAENYEC